MYYVLDDKEGMDVIAYEQVNFGAFYGKIYQKSIFSEYMTLIETKSTSEIKDIKREIA